MINEFDNNILEKINQKSKPLGLYCGAYFGIQTFDRKKYVSNNKINKDYKPTYQSPHQ